MSEFKEGDRAVAYGSTEFTDSGKIGPYLRAEKVTITKVWPGGDLTVKLFSGSVVNIHPKQLRRLIKKQRREWLIKRPQFNELVFAYEGPTPEVNEVIHVREVRRKDLPRARACSVAGVAGARRGKR